MAMTLALNSDRTVWVTTYLAAGGRCYDISMKLDNDRQWTRTFTELELQRMLSLGGSIRGLAVPEFDNVGRPLTPREAAEKVCNRVEREVVEFPPHTHSLFVGDETTSIGGDRDHQHFHPYTPGASFTEEVYRHKHPVGTSVTTGEYFVGFSIPV